jgi:zinc D-Ala-D-Ala dipeptidase
MKAALLAVLLAAPAAAQELQVVEGPHLVVQLRYATKDNFLDHDIYRAAGIDRCWARPELAAALSKARAELEAAGLKLVLWDCYRPMSVQREMWKLVPDERYVANPKKGSNHNRGAAVDVTLATSDGRPIPMPTEFDDFSAAAAADYVCLSGERDKCRHREALRGIMTKAGLVGLKTEWWHYQLPDADKLPLVPNAPRAKK